MWNAVLRVPGPFAFVGTLTIVLHLSIRELRNPLSLSLLALTALLLILRPIEREIHRSSKFRTRVLLVGNQPFARKFMEEIERCPRRGFTIVGVVEETSSSQPQLSPYLVLGTISELRTIVASVKPHRIVLALSDRRGRMPVAELLEFQSQGIVVEDVLDAYENFSGKLAIEAVTPGQLISSRGVRKAPALLAIQHVLSFIAATVMLVILAPLLLLIAIAIQLDSGGPVLFSQLRLGKRGQPFKLIKFRTMQPIDNPTSEWVQDNLKRITRVGRLLRRLRLDELPQLLNVIRGDMNLVGPRPHPVSNVNLFREAIPYYVLRCSVLPGITGWAQTRYCYANNLDQETEKMRYDLYYIKHMSLWMDLRILVSTGYVFISSFLSTRPEPRSETKAVFKRHRALIPVSARAQRSARAISLVQYGSDSENRSVEAP
jgi:exopolysaccharide biosynthesis polyprenyl glycosylphosphotransferase